MFRHLIRYAIVGIIISIFWHVVHGLGRSNLSVGPSFSQLSSLAHNQFGPIQSALASYSGGPSGKGPRYTSPEENLEKVDLSLLSRKQTDHLDIAMYAFTDRNLARQLVVDANAGIPVRIYRDREQYEDEQKRDSQVAEILRGSRNIHIRVKSNKVLMHLKAFSDGQFLRDGSANWSPSGEMKQDNSLTVSFDKDAIKSFEDQFNDVWSRGDNYVVQ